MPVKGNGLLAVCGLFLMGMPGVLEAGCMRVMENLPMASHLVVDKDDVRVTGRYDRTRRFPHYVGGNCSDCQRGSYRDLFPRERFRVLRELGIESDQLEFSSSEGRFSPGFSELDGCLRRNDKVVLPFRLQYEDAEAEHWIRSRVVLVSFLEGNREDLSVIQGEGLLAADGINLVRYGRPGQYWAVGDRQLMSLDLNEPASESMVSIPSGEQGPCGTFIRDLAVADGAGWALTELAVSRHASDGSWTHYQLPMMTSDSDRSLSTLKQDSCEAIVEQALARLPTDTQSPDNACNDGFRHETVPGPLGIYVGTVQRRSPVLYELMAGLLEDVQETDEQ